MVRTIGILAGVICAMVAGATHGEAAKREIAGKAVSVEGRVFIRNVETGDGMKQLKAGDSIRKGDVINTASDGTAKLLFSDRSIMDLSGGTLFKVDDYELKSVGDRKVQFSMDYGSIRAAVNRKVNSKGKFNVRTRSATMGVRGTEFIVNTGLGEALAAAASQGGGLPPAEQSRTEMVVVEGKVAVNNNGAAAADKKTVMVKAGEKVTTEVKEATSRAPASTTTPQKEVVAPAEMKKVVAAARVEDNTFKKQITVDRSNADSGGATLAYLVPELPPIPESQSIPCSFGCQDVGPGVPGVSDLERTVRVSVKFVK